MATKHPGPRGPLPLPPLTEEELAEIDYAENVEDDLYLSPDGTMTTYHEGDEDDEQSEWYHIVPKFYCGEQLMSLADFDDWQERHGDDPFWQEHPNGIQWVPPIA
jgi:hypothetical protein